MRLSRVFTAFAASYFALVFIKDGTAVKLTKDAQRGAQTLLTGAKQLTKIT